MELNHADVRTTQHLLRIIKTFSNTYYASTDAFGYFMEFFIRFMPQYQDDDDDAFVSQIALDWYLNQLWRNREKSELDEKAIQAKMSIEILRRPMVDNEDSRMLNHRIIKRSMRVFIDKHKKSGDSTIVTYCLNAMAACGGFIVQYGNSLIDMLVDGENSDKYKIHLMYYPEFATALAIIPHKHRYFNMPSCNKKYALIYAILTLKQESGDFHPLLEWIETIDLYDNVDCVAV